MIMSFVIHELEFFNVDPEFYQVRMLDCAEKRVGHDRVLCRPHITLCLIDYQLKPEAQKTCDSAYGPRMLDGAMEYKAPRHCIDSLYGSSDCLTLILQVTEPRTRCNLWRKIGGAAARHVELRVNGDELGGRKSPDGDLSNELFTGRTQSLHNYYDTHSCVGVILTNRGFAQDHTVCYQIRVKGKFIYNTLLGGSPSVHTPCVGTDSSGQQLIKKRLLKRRKSKMRKRLLAKRKRGRTRHKAHRRDKRSVKLGRRKGRKISSVSCRRKRGGCGNRIRRTSVSASRSHLKPERLRVTLSVQFFKVDAPSKGFDKFYCPKYERTDARVEYYPFWNRQALFCRPQLKFCIFYSSDPNSTKRCSTVVQGPAETCRGFCWKAESTCLETQNETSLAHDGRATTCFRLEISLTDSDMIGQLWSKMSSDTRLKISIDHPDAKNPVTLPATVLQQCANGRISWQKDCKQLEQDVGNPATPYKPLCKSIHFTAVAIFSSLDNAEAEGRVDKPLRQIPVADLAGPRRLVVGLAVTKITVVPATGHQLLDIEPIPARAAKLEPCHTFVSDRNGKSYGGAMCIIEMRMCLCGIQSHHLYPGMQGEEKCVCGTSLRLASWQEYQWQSRVECKTTFDFIEVAGRKHCLRFIFVLDDPLQIDSVWRLRDAKFTVLFQNEFEYEGNIVNTDSRGELSWNFDCSFMASATRAAREASSPEAFRLCNRIEFSAVVIYNEFDTSTHSNFGMISPGVAGMPEWLTVTLLIHDLDVLSVGTNAHVTSCAGSVAGQKEGFCNDLSTSVQLCPQSNHEEVDPASDGDLSCILSRDYSNITRHADASQWHATAECRDKATRAAHCYKHVLNVTSTRAVFQVWAERIARMTLLVHGREFADIPWGRNKTVQAVITCGNLKNMRDHPTNEGADLTRTLNCDGTYLKLNASVFVSSKAAVFTDDPPRVDRGIYASPPTLWVTLTVLAFKINLRTGSAWDQPCKHVSGGPTANGVCLMRLDTCFHGTLWVCLRAIGPRLRRDQLAWNATDDCAVGHHSSLWDDDHCFRQTAAISPDKHQLVQQLLQSIWESQKATVIATFRWTIKPDNFAPFERFIHYESYVELHSSSFPERQLMSGRRVVFSVPCDKLHLSKLKPGAPSATDTALRACTTVDITAQLIFSDLNPGLPGMVYRNSEE